MLYLKLICFLFLMISLGCSQPSSPEKVKVVPTIASGSGVSQTLPTEKMVQIESPQYLRWSKHKEGTTVIFSEKTATPAYTTESTTTYKLKSVAKDKIVVQVSGDLIAPDGKKHSSSFEDITHVRYISLPSIKDQKDFTRPIGTIEERDEKITVLGKEYPAKWYKAKGRVEAGDSFTETWIVDGIPGGIVKSVFTVPASKKSVTTEIVKITGE